LASASNQASPPGAWKETRTSSPISAPSSGDHHPVGREIQNALTEQSELVGLHGLA